MGSDLVSPLGPLPPGWRLAELRELATKIGSGATPRGGESVYLEERSRFALVRSQNVHDRRFDDSSLAFISDSHARELRGAELQPGDLLLNITGDGITFARACIVPQAILPACVNQHVSIIRLRPDVCMPGYLLAYLTHPEIKIYMESFNAGGSRRAITKGNIESFHIPIPPIAQQGRISDILGSLDDKIELNHRMNQTLEAMARTIFKSWFVDFEAVGSASVGWRNSTIGNEVVVLGGSTPSTTEARYWGGAFNFLTPRDMSSLVDPVILETERTITAEGLSQVSSGLLEPGTVLLSSRAPIGYLALAGIPVAVNQGFIAMVCDRDLPNYYVLQWVRHNMVTIIGNANGTTFLEISKKNFRPIEVLVPPREILDRFVSLVRPLYERITSNLRESKTIATIRDTLLPKLLSGEIRIKQAEKIVGEVA